MLQITEGLLLQFINTVTEARVYFDRAQRDICAPSKGPALFSSQEVLAWASRTVGRLDRSATKLDPRGGQIKAPLTLHIFQLWASALMGIGDFKGLTPSTTKNGINQEMKPACYCCFVVHFAIFCFTSCQVVQLTPLT
jgi:hypothetical protein